MRLRIAAVALLATACATTRTPNTFPSGMAAGAGNERWVERTLSSLTLEQKAGQVLVPVFRGYHAHPQSVAWTQLESLVRGLNVGGLILSRGDPMETAYTLNALQRSARVPLLVAADFEWGAGVQVPHGGTMLPHAMAIGATGSEELAEEVGRFTAREGRAVGVHMTYAPVVDVNNNPDNPIINIRSFGEDPAMVGRLAAAFIRGAHAGGLLTTAKHFPGHGDTAQDSHRELAVVTADRPRLDAVELPPFRAAIAAGVDAVMVAHLAVPALEPSGVAATISPRIVSGLLREELGFPGLIVSDAMDMRGITDSLPPGEAAVRALLAGQDVVLMSPDNTAAHAAIVEAARSGRLPMARLDDAVRRMLRTKVAAGLDRWRPAPPEGVWTAIGDPAAVARMQEVADRSITLLRNEGGTVPVTAARVLHVVVSGDPPTGDQRFAAVEAEVARLRKDAAFATVELRTPREELDAVLAKAREAEAVVVSAFVRVSAYKGSADMPPALAAFLHELAGANPRLSVVSFGSPYLIRQFPEVPAYLCAYSPSPLSQRAAIKALFGEAAISGRLPVTIPGLFERGAGLGLPASVATQPRTP